MKHKYLLPCGVEKALTEDVHQVLRSTDKTTAAAAAVAVAVTFLSSSEMRSAGLLSRSGLLHHHHHHHHHHYLPYHDPLLGGGGRGGRGALRFGDDFRPCDAVPLFEGAADQGFGTAPFPRADASGALVRTLRPAAVAAVSSAASERAPLRWRRRGHWFGCCS